MKKNNNTDLPPCVSCVRAERAAEGYVVACGIPFKMDLQRYVRPVNAAINEYCPDYCPQERQKYPKFQN